MAEDVIDIRKRIEEIRNEVSTAMTDGGETIIQSRPAGEVAEFSVPGVTAKTAATATANASVPDYDLSELPQTRSGLDDALKSASEAGRFDMKSRSSRARLWCEAQL